MGEKISVYLPTRNRVDLLRSRAIPSILAQTLPPFEIIIVADGCTDGTADYVNGLKDGRVRLIEIPHIIHYPPTKENQWFAGRVAPSNVGLDACNGDWIATLDDDDEWKPDCLASLLSFANSGGYEFVSAGGRNHRGKIEPYDVAGVMVGPIQTWLYKRYLKRIRFNPDCWRNETNRVCDTDLQRRFREKGVRMGYLDRELVLVMPRPGETEVGYKAAVK